MKCEYKNCGECEDHPRHDFKTINMPISLSNHKFEPAEPVATEKDSSRCSLDGAPRIPLNREGTKFGACTLVNGKDGTGGCKDPLHDYEIEQQVPAVEPQKEHKWKGYENAAGYGTICENCKITVPYPRHLPDTPCEAGSTRPAYLKDCVKEGVDCDCVGTCKFQPRPEMPPAKEIMKQTIFTQIPHAEGKCSGCLNVTYEAGDDKVNIFCNQCGAASVQQEPLNDETKKRDAIAWMEDAERWLLNPTKPNISNAAISIKQAIVTLKSQPAAPRTQGREPQIIRFKSCSGTVMFKPLESGEIEIYHDCPDSKKLAQARTQPAPKSDDLRNVVVDILSNCANKYCHPGGYARQQQTVINEQIDNAVKILQKFFAALPEATREKK